MTATDHASGVQPPRMERAIITDELADAMRAKRGLELRIDESSNNADATRFSILRFAEGIGDDNPLWTDEAYAAHSPFGTLVAPHTWIFCCFSGIQFGWPGLGAFHSASEVRFHRVVRIGDTITVRCVYDGFEGPLPSSFAGQKILDRFVVTYETTGGELVADHALTVTRFERGTAQQRAPQRRVELPHPWTDEELQAIDEAILAERPRGGDVRWWDDVNVGDELDVITKGPLGLTDQVAYVAAGGAPAPRLAAHGAALRKYRRHPKWAFRDPTTHAWEPIYSVHYNELAAHEMGAAAPYDVGIQRLCWQGHLLTNWAGDLSFVKRVHAEFRSFVYLSDVVRLGGRVTGKEIDDDGDAVVIVETSAVNQRGDNVMPGTAVVALLRREGGDVLGGR